MDDNKSDGRHILLEGNFTQYLLGLPESGHDYNDSMQINLEKVPPGTYSLFYTAYDSFGNPSNNSLSQTITIRDKQAPSITVIDLVANRGITTESKASIGDVFLDYNQTDLIYLDPQNAEIDFNWSMGRPFVLDELFVLARDNKSGTTNWNVTYNDGLDFESLDTNTPQIYELNFSSVDDAANFSSLIIHLSIIDNHVPNISISGPSIYDGNYIETYRGRGFILEDELEILVNDDFQNYQPGTLSFQSDKSLFNEVDWGGLFISEQDGKTLILPGGDSNYTVNFSYTDSSLNTGSASVVIVSKDPAFTIQGKAIDGYLKDSLVSYVSKSAGPFATTDEEGNFVLYFTDEEFTESDFDRDGNLTSEEGKLLSLVDLIQIQMPLSTAKYEHVPTQKLFHL